MNIYMIKTCLERAGYPVYFTNTGRLLFRIEHNWTFLDLSKDEPECVFLSVAGLAGDFDNASADIDNMEISDSLHEIKGDWERQAVLETISRINCYSWCSVKLFTEGDQVKATVSFLVNEPDELMRRLNARVTALHTQACDFMFEMSTWDGERFYDPAEIGNPFW